MLTEGSEAPGVCLPGYVDGERERVDLGEFLGEGIVVMAFYPADFSPACTMQDSDLGDLDLFTMQKDVSVFGVSPDSTYSHEAFAERYSLKVPLLSDVDGRAAAAYDVESTTDLGEDLCQRAVFVVDHRGVVQYSWATDDLSERVDVEPVKRAVSDIGGDDTALERYRAGYEEYTAGREAFTEAMANYEEREWLPARNGFEEAEPAFTDAADHLDTAVRFAETAAFGTVADRVEEKADTLQHAARWLAESADALGSGRGKQGTEYRDDAERLLDEAQDLPEPPDPDQFTLHDDGIELDDDVLVDPEEEEEEADADAPVWRADDEAVDTELGIDDDALDAAVDGEEASAYDDDTGDAVDGDLEMDVAAVDATEAERDGGESIEGDTVEGDLDMDLEAIDAAAEAEDEAAAEERADGESGRDRGSAAAEEPGRDEAAALTRGSSASAGGESPEGPSDGQPSGNGEAPAEVGEADEEVEMLDLADPIEMDDEEDEDDERADWDIPGR